MSRLSLIAIPLLTAAALAAATPAFAAKDAACKSTRWSLNLPSGSQDQSTTVVDGAEDRIWRVGVGGLPPGVMLVIEYRNTIGIKGELVLQPGEAQLVEGSTVTMHLRRVSGSGAAAAAGSFNAKC